tara:strand:- start:2680 stop:3573 length:894 start_codon:yes stop_codon:yes gene_type:complete
MATYNFKREAQLFILSGGNRYDIDISSVSFSQTFSGQNYAVKTLHAQSDVFEGSVINKANTANFSFMSPALREADFTVLETLLINATSFDIFVKTEADIFKLETCVLTNGTFVINKSQPLSLELQGQAVKLTRGATLSGTLQNRSATRSYTINPTVEATVGGSSLTDVVAVNMELQNSIEWTPYTTVNAALDVTNAATSMYPAGFTLSKKILSGSVTQYLTDANTSGVQSWGTATSITIKAGNGLSGASFKGFSFGPANCSFTNRMGAGGDLFLQTYDWRLVDNSSSLSSILKYETD